MNGPVQKVYYSRDIHNRSNHYHDCHQILLITEGAVDISVNTAHYRAGAGDLLLFSRYEDHSIRVLTPVYHRYVLQIDPLANQKDALYLLLSNRPKGFSHVTHLGDALPAACSCMEQLITEFNSTNPLHQEMISFLLGQLLVYVGRSLPQLQTDPQELEMVWEITHLFETRYAESWQLETLAQEHGISVSGLCHKFKTVTGSAVMAYLQDCRLASAKALLSGTDLPIGKIVEDCGFSDSSNFSRSFKAHFGMTPMQFRKQYR